MTENIESTEDAQGNGINAPKKTEVTLNEAERKLLFQDTYFKIYIQKPRFPKDYLNIDIMRRDTSEEYRSFSSKLTDKQALILQVKDFMKRRNISKPEDWQTPHRYCVAYCARIEADRDNFSGDSYYQQLDSAQWLNYTRRRFLKETALLKKVNALSFEEKKQLLVIRDWEFINASDYRVGMGIFLRGYLYDLLLDKSGLEEDYQTYSQQINEYSERSVNYKKEEEVLLFENAYFRVIACVAANNIYAITKIIRRDIAAVYKCFMIDTLQDKEGMVLQAKTYLEEQQIGKPEDWKAPHLYCINYFSRIEEHKDNMYYNSRNRYPEIDGEKRLDREVWWRYTNIVLLKERALFRKLNALTLEERKQMLRVREWEIQGSFFDNQLEIGMLNRAVLYKRLIDKTGLEENYQQYKSWLARGSRDPL